MNWWFRLLEKKSGTYKYAYSYESQEYDGVIVFNVHMNNPVIEKPCFNNKSLRSQERTCMYFWKVINEGFPEERHVCIG